MLVTNLLNLIELDEIINSNVAESIKVKAKEDREKYIAEIEKQQDLKNYCYQLGWAHGARVIPVYAMPGIQTCILLVGEKENREAVKKYMQDHKPEAFKLCLFTECTANEVEIFDVIS